MGLYFSLPDRRLLRGLLLSLFFGSSGALPLLHNRIFLQGTRFSLWLALPSLLVGVITSCSLDFRGSGCKASCGFLLVVSLA